MTNGRQGNGVANEECLTRLTFRSPAFYPPTSSTTTALFGKRGTDTDENDAMFLSAFQRDELP